MLHELCCYLRKHLPSGLLSFFNRTAPHNRAYFTHARPPRPSSTGKHKINPISLNSLNRQALTGIDRCSDGGMWMSHVFSIIYTALLFLSPPLRQVSILLRRNQSVICQTLSIRRLIYVSYCGWLHAKCDTGEENKCGERHSARRQQVFFWLFVLFFVAGTLR